MFIKTTINMQKSIDTIIHKTALSTGHSKNDIIILLLKKVMLDNRKRISIGKSVQYQDREDPEEWRTVHVRFNPDDYEYFIDLRKLLKMSVSLIIALAVEEFIHELNGKIQGDNYSFKYYYISMEVVEGIICWKLYWGKPKILKNNFLTKH